MELTKVRSEDKDKDKDAAICSPFDTKNSEGKIIITEDEYDYDDIEEMEM